MLEKEKLDKSHLNWLREQAETFPKNTHFKERVKEAEEKHLDKYKDKTKEKDIDRDRD